MEAQSDADPLAEIRRSLPADPEAARAALTDLLRETVARAEVDELSVMAAADGAEARRDVAEQDALVEEALASRRLLVALLDTVVLRTEWGSEELERLRRRYPSSVLFLRYEAKLDVQEQRYESALPIYDRLLGMRAADAELQSGRGAALEGLGRTEQAIAAYTRAFEVAPAEDPAYRALIRLRQQNGTLSVLLKQIRRLRTLYPETPGLEEREAEVLHRLGESRSHHEMS